MTTEVLNTLIFGFITNGVLLVAGYVKMRERVTRIETHLEHIMIKIKFKV